MGEIFQIGIELQVERIRARVKQIDLSDLTGIPQSRLSQIENGRMKPRPEEIKLIREKLMEVRIQAQVA